MILILCYGNFLVPFLSLPLRVSDARRIVSNNVSAKFTSLSSLHLDK